ncbi:MAG: CDP-alcohol phosphatidyltransferase family protein [Promethearchaeota archaeon]
MTEKEELPKKRVKQRETLNKYIDRPVEFLIKHNITANELSYLGLLCSISAALLIALGTIHMEIWFAWPAPFLLFMAGAFDVFDGEVARRTGTESQAGAFLDSNIDRISDAVIILGLIYGGFINFFQGYIILFLCIMISYTRSRAENEGVDMRGIGIMERAERMITLMIALVLETWIYFITGLIFKTPFVGFFLVFIWIFIILLIITLIQRISFTFKTLSNLERKKEI